MVVRWAAESARGAAPEQGTRRGHSSTHCPHRRPAASRRAPLRCAPPRRAAPRTSRELHRELNAPAAAAASRARPVRALLARALLAARAVAGSTGRLLLQRAERLGERVLLGDEDEGLAE